MTLHSFELMMLEVGAGASGFSFDWQSFVTTGLATVVGALVAGGISIWVAERSRPRPFFSVDIVWPNDASVISETVNVPLSLVNYGSADAYDVSLFDDNEELGDQARRKRLRDTSQLAVMAPGEKIDLVYQVPTTALNWDSKNKGPKYRSMRRHNAFYVQWRQGPDTSKERAVKIQFTHARRELKLIGGWRYRKSVERLRKQA